METNSKKLETFNVRKNQRFESKKRKIEALLNLFQDDKAAAMPRPKKKTKESLEQTYKDLKDELKKYIKKPEVEPNLYLCHQGLKAKVSLNSEPDTIDPLFTEDIYQLLLRSVIGHQSPFPVGWAKLEQPQNVSKTVLLVVEGVTKSDVIANKDKLSNIEDIFKGNVVEIASSNVPFASELCTLHRKTDFHLKEKNTFTTMFPSKDKEVRIETSKDPKPASKLHLLLSPIQMCMENYPFPQSVFEPSTSKGYVFTKDAYIPVTGDSPLFAVDCEMCQTETGKSELTRIAVVDENLQTVYHTLVKPHNKIVNYLTRFSGITSDMLVDVDTRLADVQKHLQTILPPDAILCGQSLNADLHAMQMIHPYVIDTSIIFNSCGVRGKKDSLKNLALRHLDEHIQTKGRDGHNPVEDATATMKLVQLKLKNGVKYGDACLEDDNKPEEPPLKEPVQNEDTSLGFFARLRKNLKKSCLIGPKEALDNYDAQMLSSAVQKFVKSSRKKILKATLKRLNEFNFVVSHFAFDKTSEEDTFGELNNILEQVNDACGNRSMFSVLLSGVDQSEFADIKRGLFLATLKKVKEDC